MINYRTAYMTSDFGYGIRLKTSDMFTKNGEPTGLAKALGINENENELYETWPNCIDTDISLQFIECSDEALFCHFFAETYITRPGSSYCDVPHLDMDRIKEDFCNTELFRTVQRVWPKRAFYRLGLYVFATWL